MNGQMPVCRGMRGALGRFAGAGGRLRAALRRVVRSFVAVVVVCLAVATSAGVAEAEKAGYPDKWLFNLPEAAFAHRAEGDEMVGWQWVVSGVYYRDGDAPEVAVLLNLYEISPPRGAKGFVLHGGALFSLFSGEWHPLESGTSICCNREWHHQESGAPVCEYPRGCGTGVNAALGASDLPALDELAGSQFAGFRKIGKRTTDGDVWTSDDPLQGPLFVSLQKCGDPCLDLIGGGKKCPDCCEDGAGVGSGYSLYAQKSVIFYDGDRDPQEYSPEDMRYLFYAHEEPILSGKTRCDRIVSQACTNPNRIYTCWRHIYDTTEYSESGLVLSHHGIVLPDDTVLAYDINEFRGVFVRLQKEGGIPEPLLGRLKWASYAWMKRGRWALSPSTYNSNLLAAFVTSGSCTTNSTNPHCYLEGE